ncbi:MAG: alkaline phosphatase family protein [Acidimicrobiales bacterium]
MLRLRVTLASVATTAVFVSAAMAGGSAAGGSAVGGRVGPATGTTANGRRLAAAGRVTRVGDFPSGGALSPDGRWYWAVDSGHGRNDVTIVAIATGRVVQVLPLPGAYGGVAFAPDGRSAYVSGEPRGNSRPAGPVQGADGDVIHRFVVDPANGQAREAAPIVLPATSGGTAQAEAGNPLSFVLQPPGPGPSTGLAWPIGLAVSPDGRTLVAALNQADQTALIDAATGATRLVKVGRYPFGTATDGTTVYVSNELDGTISVIDLRSAAVTRTITVGPTNSHPEGLVADPGTHRLYVAVTNLDQVAVIDTATGSVHAVSVGRRASAPTTSTPGTAPVAVAVSPDHRTVYAADAGEDAVAVIAVAGPHPDQLVGRIPTAAYTSGVAVTPDGKRVVWLAAKGGGAGPNPGYGQHFADSEAAAYGQYVPDMLLGRVGVLNTPSAAALRSLTRAANAAVHPADLSAAPPGTPVHDPRGGPSRQISHVFYIVKENRTYDQVFGTNPHGDGDPRLELFDDNGAPGPAGGVTPNAHRLADRFGLLDHFYADSEVSVDGHVITSSGYATDFVQRSLHANYAGRGRVLNAGQDPVTFPPNGFIFDQAARQGVSFHNDGELSAGVTPQGNDGRPTFPTVAANTSYNYPLFFGCDNAGLIPVTATNHAVACDTDSGTLGAAGNAGAAHSRFDWFQQQFQAQVAAGSVPTLTYLTLPNDHTNGVHPNYPTPKALVADNDLGLGQIVDLISHSSIWSSSAIFVVEDDSQDGADHVDAHRMPAFVISPWSRGGVVSTRYDQFSALRTVELITGLHPLALNDALAEPMYDAFVSGGAPPNLAPYTAVTPTQPLDAVVAAAPADIDGALPLGTDIAPQRLLDEALWRSVYGAMARPPAPGPHASAVEEARARAALAAFARGGDLGALLRSGGD